MRLIEFTPARWIHHCEKHYPLGESIFKKHRQSWNRKSDTELVADAKKFITKKGITGRNELEHAASGLYRALRKRKLLGELGFVAKLRNWAIMSDDELLAFAKKFLSERGIKGRHELEKADVGLYSVLRLRDLMDRIGLELMRRNWASISNDEVLAHAKSFISEMKIGGRKELFYADSRLYDALRGRDLLDNLGLAKKVRDWVGLSNDELLAFAKKLFSEQGIRDRAGLKKADSGLYGALWARKLLDAAFSDAEALKKADALDAVLSALESFGDAK